MHAWWCEIAEVREPVDKGIAEGQMLQRWASGKNVWLIFGILSVDSRLKKKSFYCYCHMRRKGFLRLIEIECSRQTGYPESAGAVIWGVHWEFYLFSVENQRALPFMWNNPRKSPGPSADELWTKFRWKTEIMVRLLYQLFNPECGIGFNSAGSDFQGKKPIWLDSQDWRRVSNLGGWAAQWGQAGFLSSKAVGGRRREKKTH